MRWTQTLIPTLREDPKDAEAVSHKLMIRAGYVRKLSSGVYSYLPLGNRVLQKVCAIIDEEMKAAGADSLLMPALHPAELWKKTGRYEALGQDKFAFKNRTEQEFVLGPTHEEVVTELVGGYVKSHKDLPKIVFQIQTKFRDEIRPRFGIIRTKEFIMKDAYSFDKDDAGLNESYRKMSEAYHRIFQRCGLTFDVVNADPGMMGGKVSQEFMVKSKFGEDVVFQCPQCRYTASREIASRARKKTDPLQGKGPAEAFDTPGLRTIEELTRRFKFKPEQLVKTILFIGDGRPIACLVRGDREVNESKVRRLCGITQLAPASAQEIEKYTGGPMGFTGPVGMPGVEIVADYDLEEMADFVTGANRKDTHLKNVNMGADFKPGLLGDVRYAEDGDLCVNCGTLLQKSQSMEIGHVFKLGTRYTQAFDVHYIDEKGEKRIVIMGCYGIGVNRILAAHIDEHHDAKGIVWRKAIAPYQVLLVTVNQSDTASVQVGEALYRDLTQAGIEVLYDDRDERAGVKFNDGELVGIPVQIIVSERNLKEGKFEVVKRHDKSSEKIPQSELIEKLPEILRAIP